MGSRGLGGADEPCEKTDNVEPQSYVCRTRHARMVFKFVEAAQKTWRRLDSHSQLPKLMVGVRFANGLATFRRKISSTNPAISRPQTPRSCTTVRIHPRSA
jgi:hypothetical protein